MNTKLLNFLAQNFKEKRLIFQQSGGGEVPAGDAAEAATAAAEAEARAAEARAAAATDAASGLTTTDEVEARTIEGGAIKVSASMPDFIYQDDQGNDYTAPEAYLMPGDIRKLKDSGTYEYYTDDNEWIGFARPASWAEAASAAPAAAAPAATDEAAAEQTHLLAEAKDRITAAEATVTEKREKITLQGLRDGIKGSLEGDDEDLKNKIAEILFPDESEIDSDFAAAAKILEDAKALDDHAAIDQKIAEALGSLKNEGHYIEEAQERADTFNPLLAFFDKYKELAGDGANATLVLDEIHVAIAQSIQDGTTPDKIIDAIKKDPINAELAKAVVADIIGETPEAFDNAIRYYKLGKYKTADLNTDPQYAASQAILAKFAENKEIIKKRGITFDFFGSTNNVNHQRVELLSWHKDKAAALQKILDLNAANPSRIQADQPMKDFITANEPLIRQYIAAVKTGTKADYMKIVDDNNALFLTGGTIFDLALRLQRAAEFKRFVEGTTEYPDTEAPTDVFKTDGTETDTVQLLHQSDTKDDGMKSGIKFGILKEAPTADEEEEDAGGDAAGGGDEVDDAGGDQGADTGADPAPEVQTNDHDHAYSIEPDGRLKVTFKGETEPKYYTIVKPDNVELQPDVITDDGNDQYVQFFAKGRTDGEHGWVDFDLNNKVFDAKSSEYLDVIYTATFDDSSNTITITATPKERDTRPTEARILEQIPRETFKESEKAIAEAEGFTFVSLQDARVVIAAAIEDRTALKYVTSESPPEHKVTPADGYEFVSKQNQDYKTKVIDKLRSAYVEAAVTTLKESRPDLDPTAEAAFRTEAGENFDAQWILNGNNNYAVEPIVNPAPADAAPPEGGAQTREALEARDRETTTALEAALGAADAEINEGIQRLEATIDTNNFFVAGALPAKITEKRGYIKEIFDEIRRYLGKAKDNIKKGKFDKAKLDYQEVARIVEQVLAEELTPAPEEAALSDESQAVIKELRDKVVARKSEVETAFTAKFAAVEALAEAPATAE